MSFGVQRVGEANYGRLDISLKAQNAVESSFIETIPNKAYGNSDDSPQWRNTAKPPKASPEVNSGPIFSGPIFFHSNELSQRPEIVTPIPADPVSMRDDPSGGAATLEIWILKSGLVARVTVNATNLSPSTLKDLTEIFQNARFSPGKINGDAVNSILTIQAEVNPQAPPKSQDTKVLR